MTPDFETWYERHEREFDGSVKQAAWLAWQARDDAREVAQVRIDSMAGGDGYALGWDEEICKLLAQSSGGEA